MARYKKSRPNLPEALPEGGPHLLGLKKPHSVLGAVAFQMTYLTLFRRFTDTKPSCCLSAVRSAIPGATRRLSGETTLLHSEGSPR